MAEGEELGLGSGSGGDEDKEEAAAKAKISSAGDMTEDPSAAAKEQRPRGYHKGPLSKSPPTINVGDKKTKPGGSKKKMGRKDTDSLPALKGGRARKPRPSRSSKNSSRGSSKKNVGDIDVGDDFDDNGNTVASSCSNNTSFGGVAADLINSTQYLAYSWDALRLGTELGTVALNERLGLSGEHALTAVQALEIINTLRTRTLLPPPGSALHAAAKKDPGRLGTDGRPSSLLRGEDNNDGIDEVNEEEEDEDGVKGNKDENKEDQLSPELSKPPSCPSMQTAQKTVEVSTTHPTSPSCASTSTSTPFLPLPTLDHLYRMLCEQDADDGSTSRRTAHYLTAEGCVERLRGLENRTCELMLRQRDVMRRGRALGLTPDVNPEMREEVRRAMGYRTEEEMMPPSPFQPPTASKAPPPLWSGRRTVR